VCACHCMCGLYLYSDIHYTYNVRESVHMKHRIEYNLLEEVRMKAYLVNDDGSVDYVNAQIYTAAV